MREVLTIFKSLSEPSGLLLIGVVLIIAAMTLRRVLALIRPNELKMKKV